MNGSETNVEYLAGRFEPDHEHVFHHEPFDVPSGLSQIRIQISYNDRIASDPGVVGGNVLDVGLFDARGTESGGDGFRGWSGSDKLDLTIGVDWATPPYIPGTLQEGTWNLLLGSYKIGPNGLDWSARIEFDPEPRSENAFVPPRVELPEPPGNLPPGQPGWFRGDLHAHTVFSDGSSFPAQIAAAARASGIDFYGITDHNRAESPVPHVPTGPDWPVLVPGVEVTTYAGHFNVWGTDRWYNFRQPDAEGLQQAVDEAIADGGFVSMNHPKPFGPDWEYPEVTGFEAVEVWNGWWDRLNNISTRVWEEQLRRGRRIPPLGGSDVHHLIGLGPDDNPFIPARLGFPTTWVRLSGPLTADSILAAIRVGEVFISESPSGPQLVAERASQSLAGKVVDAKGDALLLIDQSGVIDTRAIVAEEFAFDFSLQGNSDYVRLEIHRAAGGIRALTNAFWPD